MGFGAFRAFAKVHAVRLECFRVFRLLVELCFGYLRSAQSSRSGTTYSDFFFSVRGRLIVFGIRGHLADA